MFIWEGTISFMNWKKAVTLAAAGTLLLTALLPSGAFAAEDRTSKYRVYQNDRALKEFASEKQAIQYAESFTNSYVEHIASRKWVWHHFPNYKVYQKDYSRPEWEFDTLEEAVREAKKWADSSVRKLSEGGWVWDNYEDHPGYTLYQGEKTLPNWTFRTLEEAQKEAKKWANAHIIDNATNKWVWDNIPAERKAALRSQEPVYRVYQGTTTLEEWSFAFLKDAVDEAVKWANSTVVNEATGKTVYSNHHPYLILQNGARKSSAPSLAAAIDRAKKLENAAILWNHKRIWSNEPYYVVYQSGKKLDAFSNPADAAAYALKWANSQVITLDGQLIWDHADDLMYLAWNGSSSHQTIVSQVNNTQGLDVDSPSWFSLADANGELKDDSNPETVRWLQAQGIEVHPLVHNQFDPELTSKFLANEEAQKRFINQLVSRLKEIGADGVNIDFESMKAADRDRFTAFVKRLGEAAKAEGLTVSIDLIRGSAAWNHLTVYDHEKLHQYADYVIIMAYDQFWRGSESPGPVSGLQWAETGVEEFLSYGIPRSKLVLGVPLYIRVWEVDAAGKLVSNRAVWMKDIEEAMAGAKVNRSFDERYGLEKVEYSKDGKHYVFWMEDIETIKKRVDIAKRHDLAGVAFWRLGYEPAELWTELLRMK